MGLFKVIKKKEAPKELPGLVLPGQSAPRSAPNQKQQRPIPSPAPSKDLPSLPSFKPLPIERKMANRFPNQPQSVEEPDFKGPKEEKTFYKEILNTITEDIKDVDKIDDWYNKRFMAEDVLKKMRNYWEKKKPELVMQNIGLDLKEKIADRSDRLHSLEKEWQDMYFALISKEDEIRKEEREVKKLLTEYMELCKKAVSGPKRLRRKASQSKRKRRKR